jgi:hypothetical protein
VKLETFLRKFRRLAAGKKWRLTGPCKSRIRLAETSKDVCPIAFVATEEGLGDYRTEHWSDAARDLGLNEDDANDIAYLADVAVIHGVRQPIRRRFLAACGLKERV